MVSAGFTPGGITSTIAKTRTHPALDRFNHFVVFHFDAVQIGADTA